MLVLWIRLMQNKYQKFVINLNHTVDLKEEVHSREYLNMVMKHITRLSFLL